MNRTAALAAGAAALALVALTACGGSPAPKAASPASTSASSMPVASPAPQAATDPNGETCPALDSAGYCPGYDPIACSTIVDSTGYENGPLSAERAIAFMDVVLTTDALNLSSGNASNDDLLLLDEMASELTGTLRAADWPPTPPSSPLTSSRTTQGEPTSARRTPPTPPRWRATSWRWARTAPERFTWDSRCGPRRGCPAGPGST